MSVLVEIYRVPEPVEKDIPVIGLKDCSEIPFLDDEFLKESIDLNEFVTTETGMIFYAKVREENNTSPYKKGDVLVVNRSWPIQNNKLVVCCIGEEFMLKRVNLQDGSFCLESLNGMGKPLLVTEDKLFMVWGVVTHEVRRLW